MPPTVSTVLLFAPTFQRGIRDIRLSRGLEIPANAHHQGRNGASVHNMNGTGLFCYPKQ